MKIAIWLEQTKSGGVDTHLGTLLRNWPDLSDQFYIFTNSDNPSIRAYELFDVPSTTEIILMNRRLAFVKTRKFAEILLLPLYLLWTSHRARMKLKNVGTFDVFIADQGGYPSSWSTLGSLRAAKKLGIKKRILLIHHQAAPRRPFLNTLEAIVDRKVAAWSTLIITVSNATRSTLIDRRDFDLVRRPIRVIHNGLDERVNPTRGCFRSLLEVSSNLRIVAMVGRVELYKGHEELIRAIALLPIETRRNLLLAIVGTVDVSMQEYLTDLAIRLGVNENIRFCGFVDLDSTNIIADVDLMVCATQEFEGFGYTVLEAMSVGTPVLATAVGAIQEFCDTRFGLIIRPGSIQEMADAIDSVFSDPIATENRVISAKVQSKFFTGNRMALEMYRELKY
jgi:glycosyltransferase involved in cell wall biosynthesis